MTTSDVSTVRIGAQFKLLSADWLAVPCLGFLAIFFAVPVAQLVSLSFIDPKGALNVDPFRQLFSSSVYVAVLWITLKIAFFTAMICVCAGYVLAYFLATTTPTVRSRLLLFVILPLWTSFLVRAFAWIVLLGRHGAINTLLRDAGVINQPLPLLYNLFGALIGTVHSLMPLGVVTMLAVMLKINRNLSRAASTLGARPAVAFIEIFFPLSIPGVAAAGLLVFILSMGFFITPALLGGAREIMIAQVIIEQVLQLLNWRFAGAVSLLLLVTTLVFVAGLEKLFGSPLLAGRSTADVRRLRLIKVFSSVLQLGGRMLDRIASARGEAGSGQGGQAGIRHKRVVLGTLAVTTLLFLSVPALFLIPMSLTQDAYLNWPPRGVSSKWYLEVLQQERWRHAIVRSTLVGLSAALVSVVLGIPAALAVERGRGALRKVLFAIFLTPMIVPHIIIAVGSYYFFARLDLLGTSLALTLGHTVVCIPYVIIVMTAVLQTYDRRLDYAAWSLGANKLRAFRHVMLPIIGPGVAAAFIFAFVTSFDELTIAMFVLAGETTTVPKELWDSAILSVRPAVAAVSVLVLSFVSLLLLIAEYLRRSKADAL